MQEEKPMRTLNVEEISKNIKEMCIEANHFLSPDRKKVFDEAAASEESPLGRQILGQLEENLCIAGEEMIPICQDTGMAVVFIKVGQDVHLIGGSLTDAINEGVRQGYVDGYREADRSPLAHAEIMAIDAASRTLGGWRLLDSALYVTLEPCPMCAGAILHARLEQVIYGTADPKGGAVDSGAES